MLDPGPAALIQADALCLPLADESVDLVVTSPPYFGLRSYTDQGKSYSGQLGSEPSPAEFLAALWAATAECKRVLKPGGSIFVNLGDKYAAGHGGSSTEGNGITIRKHSTFEGKPKDRPDLPDPPASWSTRDVTGRRVIPGTQPKSLMLLPEAYRLGCTGMLAQLGGPDPGLDLIARSVIVWQKVNGLPESVRDRVRRSHEDWVHLVKSPRYYSAVDEIRESYAPASIRRYETPFSPESENAGEHRLTVNADYSGSITANPLGKLPGSVWSVPSEPLRLPLDLGIDHYAAFPSEWPRRLILGFSPPGICLACGEGRVPVVDKQGETWRQHADRMGRSAEVAEFDADRSKGTARRKRTAKGGHNPYQIPPAQHSILGYACACTPHTGLDGWTPPPTRPAVVLDPFSGTGTTVMTARALGRLGVGVDLSMDYCRAAAWRVWDGPGVQKVRDRTWPPPPGPRRKRKPARRPGVVAGEIGLAEQPALFAS